MTHWLSGAKKNPLGVASYAEQGASAYPDVYAGVKTPEHFADALLKEQGLFAHSVMWLALDQLHGGYEGDAIFFRAAVESYLANPKALLLIYDGLVEFFFFGDVIYNSGSRQIWDSRPAIGAYIPVDANFSKGLAQELKASGASQSDHVLAISEVSFYWINFLKTVGFVVVVMTIAATWFAGRKAAGFAFLCLLTLGYHAAVAVVFAAPHFRYTAPHVPLILILAILSVEAFRRLASPSSG